MEVLEGVSKQMTLFLSKADDLKIQITAKTFKICLRFKKCGYTGIVVTPDTSGKWFVE
jgi:hypothetical protein